MTDDEMYQMERTYQKKKKSSDPEQVITLPNAKCAKIFKICHTGMRKRGIAVEEGYIRRLEKKNTTP